MTTTILGVNSAYHESSVCILRDGVILGAVEEERFNRVKHAKCARVDNPDELPDKALEWALRSTGIKPEEIDHIGFSFDPEKRLAFNRDLHEKNIPPGDYGTPEGEEIFYQHLQKAAAELRRRFPKAKFHFLGHHLCHAASTFFPSRHERAGVIAIDGIGESGTTWLGVGEGNRLTPLMEVAYPNSLGFVWEKISEHLGFDLYGGPGKLMGYACISDPIGEDSGVDYAERFRQVIKLTDSGFTVDNDVMRFRTRDFTGLEPLFGPRRAAVVDRFEEASIAAGLQVVTEEVFVHLARLLHKKTGLDALCLAGGVALNCVANSHILQETPIRFLHVQPAANDGGTAIGAACLIWNQVLGNTHRPRLEHTYLGPEYTEAEIAAALKDAGLQAIKPDNLPRVCARLIYDGNVVAWFQGRLEFGPRALGNRSILADPSRFDIRNRLNAKVKERESFRPFAPSVLAEDVGRFLKVFDDMDAAEYMLLALPVREARDAQRIPAVTQENGITRVATSRAHVVRREINPIYASLLDEMKALSGVGMVLNTSFNISEPVVCSPADAINCFKRSRMDALAIGPFLVKR
ncbi:MAG: carbamoyl transferase [Candidatus Riflebacteria bacterium]|nr:carbamoyl transferase [Candidatus Riflebacteria bacterium]